METEVDLWLPGAGVEGRVSDCEALWGLPRAGERAPESDWVAAAELHECTEHPLGYVL